MYGFNSDKPSLWPRRPNITCVSHFCSYTLWSFVSILREALIMCQDQTSHQSQSRTKGIWSPTTNTATGETNKLFANILYAKKVTMFGVFKGSCNYFHMSARWHSLFCAKNLTELKKKKNFKLPQYMHKINRSSYSAAKSCRIYITHRPT